MSNLACRVGGQLQGLGVRQAECGLNLTVALSMDGRLWQMGATGAPPDKRAPWEGARSPEQVTPTHGSEAVLNQAPTGLPAHVTACSVPQYAPR